MIEFGPPSGVDEITVDVLVAGAGAGGMTAALACKLHGLDVLLCEKSGLVGGTTATSAGTIWTPGTRQAREAGFKGDVANAHRYLAAVIGPSFDDRRAAYLQTAPDAVEFLERNSEVKFQLYARHPDYLSNQPGTTLAGRALMPVPFDGRLLGADFAFLRPPIGEFMALGGMIIGRDDIDALTRTFGSVAAFRRAMSLVARHAMDRIRHRRGTRLLMGNALAGRLFYSLRRAGVPIWLEASLQRLSSWDGAIAGATLDAGGRSVRVNARRGVVLATGGFGGSVERLNEHVRPPLAHAVAFAGAEGDGLKVARLVGAAIESDHVAPVFWSPVSDTRWLEGGRGAYPHLALDRAKPGLIAVNSMGRRFVDEAVSYHDFVVGMHRMHALVQAIPAWLICDRAFLRKYGLGRVPPARMSVKRYVASGYLAEAPTLEALAARIGVDAAGLQESVSRNNHFATTGTDLDFGKGSTDFDRHNGDPAHAPNPCLGPIATPPFYAMAVYPSTLGSSIGLHTDKDGRVLSAQGRPIPHLYACGNDMASIMRGHYPGPGITLGPALVFAYRAAMALAAET